MESQLTQTALQLEPKERLALAQILINSVQESLEPTVEFSPSERQDFLERLQDAQNQPLSGSDKNTFLAALKSRLQPQS
jgi:hypothetical protein